MKSLHAGIAIAALTVATAAQGALFQNGSFENPLLPDPSPFVTLVVPAGSAAITGWLVGGHSIDYIGSYWEPAEGKRSLDMNGLGLGSIAQTFDTAASQLYRVDFAMAGNPDGGPTVKKMQVSVDNTSATFADYTFDITGKTKAAMGWIDYSFVFTASGASTTLNFASSIADPCCYGPALDNVRVTAVPEPGTYAMLLAGLGMLGFIARRRTRVA